MCVFHTAVLIYMDADRIGALRALLGAVEREVAWIGGEAAGVLVADDGREPRGRLHFALAAGARGALVQRARMGHHGGWLEWFG